MKNLKSILMSKIAKARKVKNASLKVVHTIINQIRYK